MRDEEYIEVINELVNEFKNSLTEFDENLVNAFEERIYESIDVLKNSESKFISKTKDSICSTIRRIASDYISYDLERKKQELLIDENFEKIKQISGYTYNLATKLIDGEKVEESLNTSEVIEVLEKLLSTVKAYNKNFAKDLVSETILDLKFIKNPNTEIVSLRIGHILQNRKRTNEIKNKEIDI